MLLIGIQKCRLQYRFQNSLLPQLIEQMQTRPEQLELVLGDKMIHLERALLGWQQELTCNELNDYQAELQHGGKAMLIGRMPCMQISSGSIRKIQLQSISVHSGQATSK